MAEPEWAKILTYLYENEGRVVEIIPDNGYESDEKKDRQDRRLRQQLVENINMQSDREEIVDVLEHLERMNLITYRSRTTEALIQLDPEGFRIAHDREIQKRHTNLQRDQNEIQRKQNTTNQLLIVVTWALVAASGVQAIGSINTVRQGQRAIMVVELAVWIFIVTTSLIIIWSIYIRD